MTGEQPLTPTTTTQQDLTTAGQRKVNLIWEYTQAFVAIVVVLANMLVAAYNALSGGGNNEHPVILSSSLFLVIGFYFSRTNHAQIGGIGEKPSQEYKGR